MMRQSELARALGVSRQRVHQMVRDGMPVDSLEAAQEWRAANLDPLAILTAEIHRAPDPLRPMRLAADEVKDDVLRGLALAALDEAAARFGNMGTKRRRFTDR